MIPQQLNAALFALALISLGAAVIGLYARPREFWRGFWFMCGLWGLIDGIIAWSALVQPPMPLDELHGILGINLGLQAIYWPIGLIMLFRRNPLLKGFGWGILVQALLLAIIDAIFWFRTATS